jgi:flavin reductase (DIM6/NTAB) family NADH-FMN oxidoreductase RutF
MGEKESDVGDVFTPADELAAAKAAAIQADFRAAMRRTAAGVTLVTTDGPHGRAGLTVSTLCSLSLEPCSVIACVNRSSATLTAIRSNGIFAASILAQGQAAIAEAFAGAAPAERRFDLGTWYTLVTGAPLLEGALASFDCRLADTHDFGSHCIVIGTVEATMHTETQPLVYSQRQYHHLVEAS